MKKISIGLVLVIAVSMIFSGCKKEEVYRVVKINHFEGEVTVLRDEKMNAFEGLQLISEDTVETGESSKAELLADSDKHILAEENTKFVLKATGTEKSGNITINLLYGTSLIEIENKLSEESYFEVTTPNATLSVRGTTFEVNYDEETETTSVEVIEGVVAVTNGEETEELIAGQATAITDDGIAPVSEIEETTNAPIGPRTERQDHASPYSIDEYDANGNVIKRSDYNPGGTLDFYHTYEYDANGNMIKESVYRPDGTLTGEHTYEYDANGNKIKESFYNPDGTLRSEYTF